MVDAWPCLTWNVVRVMKRQISFSWGHARKHWQGPFLSILTVCKDVYLAEIISSLYLAVAGRGDHI